MRSLIIVLGDQLDPGAAAFDGFDPSCDAVWMAEVDEESTHVWSLKQRIAIFLSAMRHFAQSLADAGVPLHYVRIDDAANRGTLEAELTAAIDSLAPSRLVMTAPGDWRVLQLLKAVAADRGLALEIREDRHFFATVRDFASHAKGRKTLRLAYYYRELRQRHRILMEDGADGSSAGTRPVGGQWSYDADNRESFGSAGPGPLPAPLRFVPDAITREVIALVDQRFAVHPGSLADFAWPVTRADALLALETFIAERLPRFGRHQDALWQGEPWLFHSQLSSSLNLKLLNPREVVAAAEAAWRSGAAPLAGVEGFIRQILGWREYVRGIYWTRMPGLAAMNSLNARGALPAWYWTGETRMACLRDAIGQTLRHGYAHHIQRLMVTGLYPLLLGVDPVEVHRWYLAVYVDAVEWVELPNTFGMSQYADGGLMASKPYVATGRYIDRMSNHCTGCRYDPAQRIGDTACPFTTLYWDFLVRHAPRLASNPRMTMQLRNAQRLTGPQREAIAVRADAIRSGAVS